MGLQFSSLTEAFVLSNPKMPQEMLKKIHTKKYKSRYYGSEFDIHERPPGSSVISSLCVYLSNQRGVKKDPNALKLRYILQLTLIQLSSLKPLLRPSALQFINFCDRN